MTGLKKRRIVVIKMGGSVLADTMAYEMCAQFLARRVHCFPEERFVVVVSAQGGSY
jgi:aspartokinase